MYEIEKGIPVPIASRTRKENLPLGKMEVNDSFFFPAGKEESYRIRGRISQAASHMKNRTGEVFTVRTVEGGVRCWRIA